MPLSRARLERVAHFLRPVLVVAGRHEEPGAEQLRRIEVDVERPSCTRCRSRCARGSGRDGSSQLEQVLRAGAAYGRLNETWFDAGGPSLEVVEALASPRVVRLPGVDGHLRAWRHVAARRRCTTKGYGRGCPGVRPVEAARASPGSSRSPSRLESSSVSVTGQLASRSPVLGVERRDRLRGSCSSLVARGEAGHQSPARAAVPADPVDLDPVPGRGFALTWR